MRLVVSLSALLACLAWQQQRALSLRPVPAAGKNDPTASLLPSFFKSPHRCMCTTSPFCFNIANDPIPRKAAMGDYHFALIFSAENTDSEGDDKKGDDSKGADNEGGSGRERLKELMVGGIKWYRNALSPFMPPNCRFLPSCSNYGIQAIETFGPWRGGLLTAWRILRCNPFGGSGYDPPRWPPF